MKKKEFINPIDKDKISENPSTLPYAHTLGGALINPYDLNKKRGLALTAMEQQTDLQLDQIKKQIDLLAQQAKEILERKELSKIIYSAHIGFKPQINHTYYLYEKEDGSYTVSMIGPNEWGKSKKAGAYVHTIRLMADSTWEILDSNPEKVNT